MVRRREDVSDMEIDTSPREPVRLNPPNRKPRRRATAWDEGLFESMPRLLLLVIQAIGVLFLLALLWGLFFAPRRGANNGPTLPDSLSGAEIGRDIEDAQRVAAERVLEDDEG